MNLWQALLHGLGEVLSFLYDFIPNYGVAIILLTLLTRVAMLPLTIKQMRAQKDMQVMSAKMQEIQPEIQRIKQKHKGDRQKINEETMRLYQEHGLNPMGSLMGCLPLLLQMPVFIALFNLLRVCEAGAKGCTPGTAYLPAGSALLVAIAAGNSHFLGMDLLITPNQAFGMFGLIASLPYYLLVALMAVGMLYATKQMQRAQPPPPPNPTPQQQQQQTMQRMFKYFPLMFAVFGLGFPAGLSLYWTTSQVWTVIQQYFMITRKLETPDATKAPAVSNPDKQSWLKRLLPAAPDVAGEAASPNGSKEPQATTPPANGSKRSSNRSKKKKKKRGRRR